MPDWAPLGIMVGMSVGDIVGAIVAVSWFLRGTWRASVVDSDAGVDVEE